MTRACHRDGRPFPSGRIPPPLQGGVEVYALTLGLSPQATNLHAFGVSEPQGGSTHQPRVSEAPPWVRGDFSSNPEGVSQSHPRIRDHPLLLHPDRRETSPLCAVSREGVARRQETVTSLPWNGA